jgi:hypothetical protein
VRPAANAPAAAEESVRANPVRGELKAIAENTEMSRSE